MNKQATTAKRIFNGHYCILCGNKLYNSQLLYCSDECNARYKKLMSNRKYLAKMRLLAERSAKLRIMDERIPCVLYRSVAPGQRCKKYLHCKYYLICLDLAAHHNWPGWTNKKPQKRRER